MVGVLLALVALGLALCEERPPAQGSPAPSARERASASGSRVAPPSESPESQGPGQGPEDSSTPSATPGPQQSEGTGDAPDPDPAAATLRPVRGRVVDAATRQPIAGAWVTWRPPPVELVERLLPEAEVGDPGISDVQGYFVLERLPSDLALAHTVYALARGYGFASQRADASGEVVLALPAACGLELVLDPPPPPSSSEREGPPVQVTLEPVPATPALRRLTAGLAPWGAERERYRLGHLPPGRYRVRVDPQVAGQRVHEVELRPGTTTRLRITRAPRAELGGAFVQLPEAGPEGRALIAVDTETLTRYELRLGPQGTFEAELPQARYALVLQDGLSERSIPGRFEPQRDLQLEPPSRGDEVELQLQEGSSPLVSSELGLVRLDQPFGDLIALAPRGSAGLHVGRAPPGRYALFLGLTLVAELSLPRPPGSGLLRVERSELWFEFPLPAGLGPEEEVRGTLSLVPMLLEEQRPDLAPRFASAGVPFVVTSERPLIRVALGLPGRYRAAGVSDLGPCQGTHELAAGARPRLELGR